MSSQRIVIIGAGLAGSLLAHRLSDRGKVVVVELAQKRTPLALPLEDRGWPGRLDPIAGSGLGGTTAYWHNGLIELERDDYAKWPIGSDELAPYFAAAYPILADTDRETLSRQIATCRETHIARGIPESAVGNCLYIPQRRKNLWRSLGVSARGVETIFGQGIHLGIGGDGRANYVVVKTANALHRVEGDVFIMACGGLASPALLQRTCAANGLASYAAGRFYHDHPMAWVGRLTVDTKLYDIWNFKLKRGALRTPLLVRDPTGKFAFYLRPSGVNQRRQIVSVLTELRNRPFELNTIWTAIRTGDDILEALAFKAGITLPTRTFAVLMVAEQSPSAHLSISTREDGGIQRDWNIDANFLSDAAHAIQHLPRIFGNQAVAWQPQPDWQGELHSAAHHSGACRMADNAQEGACDPNLRVFGTQNVYVCDGSVLPSSGYANTGLTIAALALRLADHIRDAA